MMKVKKTNKQTEKNSVTQEECRTNNNDDDRLSSLILGGKRKKKHTTNNKAKQKENKHKLIKQTNKHQEFRSIYRQTARI